MPSDIMRLSLTEFNKSSGSDRGHKMNRYMGGHRRTNHPFISGYWYLILDPPATIFQDEGVNVARDWFHSTAEGFTPPTTSVTKVDVPGMGGQASSYRAGTEYTREFSTTFREYMNLPISTAIRTWLSFMDPHMGRSPLQDYIPAAYKGQCFAILCKPTVGAGDLQTLTPYDVEQVYYMSGVFPTTVPDDAFASDIATNDVLQLSVTFSFDGSPYTKEVPGVVDEAVRRLNAIAADNTFELDRAAMTAGTNAVSGFTRIRAGL